MHEKDQHSRPIQQRDSLGARWQRFCELREPALRQDLIKHYLNFARTVAAKLYRLRIDDSVAFDDYLQYARAGLIEAVDCFNPTMTVMFESFAFHRIRGSILNGLTSESELSAQRNAGLPTGLYERLHSFDLSQTHDSEDDTVQHWVGKVVGITIGLMLDNAEDGVADENIHANPYARNELVYLRRRILKCLDSVPAREREIIMMHYFDHMEFQAIAEKLAISKGRVSQLHARGLMQLRTLLGKEGRLDASM